MSAAANVLALDLGPTRVDLNKLVAFNPDPHGTKWRCIEGSERRGLIGVSIGTICLRHAAGYEVLLQLEDGRLASFAPDALAPASPLAQGLQP